MARVVYAGKTMDARTRDMFIELKRITKLPLVITQGCYNKGGVAASAGTHDGGGCIDVRVSNLTAAQRLILVYYARKIGFAAWYRTPSEGKWVAHCHMVAVACPDLSRGAKAQVVAYKAGKNGLANNRKDTSTVSAFRKVTWELYKKSISKPNGGGSGAAPPIKVNTGAIVHAKSVQYAQAGGYFHVGQKTALAEVKIFVYWCKRLGVATDKDVRVWETFIRQGNWKSAGLQLSGIIRKLQKTYRKPITGKFDSATAAIMKQDNYRVV